MWCSRKLGHISQNSGYSLHALQFVHVQGDLLRSARHCKVSVISSAECLIVAIILAEATKCTALRLHNLKYSVDR